MAGLIGHLVIPGLIGHLVIPGLTGDLTTTTLKQMPGQAGHDGMGPCMTGLNVIMNILTCHPERSEGSLAKESS